MSRLARALTGRLVAENGLYMPSSTSGGGGGGGIAITSWVEVTEASSPVVPVNGIGYICNLSSGNIIFNPVAGTIGQGFAVKLLPGVGGPGNTNTVTINAPGGGDIEQLVPENGIYSTDALVFTNASPGGGDSGTMLVFRSDGAGNLGIFSA
jgi:hypothetical protein